MPLHLLGKKSWNVYNADNIAKVKRDEAAAKAKEEAEEQRMQENDAKRRMSLLRGEDVAPLVTEDRPDGGAIQKSSSYGVGRERKRRKKAGENDTDFEMRLANEATQSSNTHRQIVLSNVVDAPLVDQKGHIDLFPQDATKKPLEKNPEAEAENARKQKEYEDQYTMRFSNAAGFKQGLDDPWYSKAGTEAEALDDNIPTKDVWGNKDPGRRNREVARVVSSDPLVIMREGAAKVRQIKRERKTWNEEKERELKELRSNEKRKKSKRRYKDDDEDDLEHLSLDAYQHSSVRSRSRDHNKHREQGNRHEHQYRVLKHDSLADLSGHRHRHRHIHRD